MDKMTVGKIVELTGIGRETLRYYEKIGLIKKNTSENKYRVYTAEDAELFIFIQKMQLSGFKLSKIKEIIGLLSQGENRESEIKIKEIINERLKEIDDKIIELNRMKEMINITLNSEAEKNNDCFVKKVAERLKNS